MKQKVSPLTKLRRRAWCGLVGGYLLAILYLVLAAAAIHLRNRSQRYWMPEHVDSFKHECLAALAATPDLAERFERFCGHFNLAAETAQSFMGFFALFCVLVSVFAVGHAMFSRMVLQQLKQNGILTKASEDIDDGARNP